MSGLIMVEPITARQFWVRTPGCGEIRQAVLSPRQDDDVLVRSLYSGISRGTESLVFKGEVPSSEYQTMRAPFQEGEFPGPVKYGYSSVGEVLEGPERLVGRTVFCLHPHQDLFAVPATAVTLLPDRLPAGRAVLAANMETAINAFWDARPLVGDRIVVVGAGVVGLLIGWLCRHTAGAEVNVIDVNPAREQVARELALPFLVESPAEANADLVFHASGRPEGLRCALAVAGVEATIVEVSWYGSRTVPLQLGEAFHARRLTIKSSQVGLLSPLQAPRWSHARRMSLALNLLQDERLDVLISGESPFGGLPDVMARLSQEPGDTLCHRIRYREGASDPCTA
ncbi:MAG: zinc-binding alcohol dehydrogenase [Vicinamibacterales bacterium]|nr:zinc-binding alcohol dehydrogenase [Vicinamibacterales bacterium]